MLKGHVHWDRMGALGLGLWLVLASAIGCGSSKKEESRSAESDTPASGVAANDEICGNATDDDSDGEPDCSDPDCLAVVSDPTQPAAFSDTISWLYSPTGDGSCGPLQQGVVDGALNPSRVGVVRGIVRDVGGQPLAGATIRVVGAPELGRTHSRGDGMFDLAVNAGGKITLEIGGAEFLTVHRRTAVPVHDFGWVEPSVLLPRSNVATRVALSGSSSLQVVRAEASEDFSGRRSPVVLFPPGMGAMAQAADGSETPLDSLNVRLTEFTVGDRGPQAMPADLPESSAYTYAFEISADEAEESGATGVRFDQALPVYLENFLGFPAGTPVPVGYYDREAAAWQAQTDGLVIAIVSEAAGLAELDLDGDGVPETRSELTSAGVSPEERQRLAELYEPGQTLWRVPIQHFSAFDFNWPFGFPSDFIAPIVDGLLAALTDTPACAGGSILRVDNQTLGEAIGVAGTGYTLHYQSDRSPGGQARSIDAQVSGDTIPASLKRIDAKLRVAGQIYETQLEPTAGARFRYAWDGLNAYGRPVQGAQRYSLDVAYVYDGVYATSDRASGSSFAEPGNVQLVGNRTRQEVSSVRRLSGSLGGWDARGQGLGGLSLDVHHAYDTAGNVLYYGDGRQRSSETVPPLVTDVLAGRDFVASEPLALEDGSLLFVSAEVIYRLADGEVTPFAGGGTPSDGLGDGGPALSALLTRPRSLNQGPDGSIYFWANSRIRRVDPTGQISTVLGGGDDVLLNEGDLALEVDPISPSALAISAAGVLYFSELGASNVFRVLADGRLEQVAGGSRNVEGGPARGTAIFDPIGLGFGPDGSLYIAGGSANTVWKVDPDGLLTRLVGQGIGASTSEGDGGPAIDATSAGARDVAVDARGNIFIAEGGSRRIRRIDPSGFIDTFASVYLPADVSLGRDGALYVGAGGSPDGDGFDLRNSIYKITPSLPGATFDDLLIAAEDGSEIYRFDALGRHLSTVDALNGVELRRFEYDGEGRLARVIEDDRRTTSIERAADGAPTAIVSPYGVRTALAVNAEGLVERVTDAAGQSVALEYAEGGLLTALIDQRGGRHQYTYDEQGRLIADRDPSGAEQTLSRAADGRNATVTHTSALGRATLHERLETSAGVEQRVTTPGGAISSSLRDKFGNVTATSADGTTIATVFSADPRFGSVAPVSAETRVTLPSGLESVVTQARVAELANANDALSLSRLQNEVSLNGRVFTTEYDAATRTLVQRSAEGRELTTVLDEKGRVSEARAPGLLSTFYEYDADGRLVGVTSGDGADVRRVTFQHTPEGWVGSVSDALGQSTTYTLDALGRTTSTLYADGTSAGFAYDAAGQLATLTPPGQAAHAFEYDVRGLSTGYTPPELASGATPTSYAYDADQALTSVGLPGTAPLLYSYDTAGRLSSVEHAGGTVMVAYDAAERMIEAQSPDGITLAYAYDGALPTSTTWSGAVAGSVTRSYDENLFVTALAVNGTSIAYGYDDDGLLTQAGALQLTHDATNGLLTASSVANLDSTFAYSPRGELASHAVTAGTTALYAAAHTRDALGRIASTSETIAGTTTANVYTYDAVGQLVEVTTNGAVSASYAYDPDGNRLSTTTAATSANATYDAQERLLTFGDSTYAYTPRGTLESRTTAGATTQFTYDPLGNLSAVGLPDGRNISYLADAESRRVAKLVDGTMQRAWLYQDSLRPIAELDAAGAVTSRFVYASRANVPDLMLQGGVTYALIADIRGSVRLVVNASTGAVAQRIDYGPFGEVIADTAPGFQPFGFAGGLYDPDTGLVRFGARDYDAQIGRWLAKDPIGFGGGQSNLYGYVANDPVNLVDPSGLIADIFLDAAFIGFDLYAIYRDNIAGNCDNLGSNLGALGLDVAGAAVPGVTGLGAASRGAKAEVEIVQRGMSRAELAATRETGLLRGGREGTHYVSDAVNTTGKRAQQRLALPQRPEVRVTMEVPAGRFSAPTRVEPRFNMPGGGMERTATGPVRVRVLDVNKL